MAERALRGSRLGAQSYETDAGVEMAPRQSITYNCPDGHRFAMPFSLEADVPDVEGQRAVGAAFFRNGQVILGIDAATAGDGDNFDSGMLPPQFDNGFQSFLVGHEQVGDDEIG